MTAACADDDRVLSNRLDLTRVHAPAVIDPFLDRRSLTAIVQINSLCPVALIAHRSITYVQLIDNVKRSIRCVRRVRPDQSTRAWRTNTPVERQEARLFHKINSAPSIGFQQCFVHAKEKGSR